MPLKFGVYDATDTGDEHMTTNIGELSTADLRFTLMEAAEVLEVEPDYLRHLIERKVFRPAEPGSKGRGKQHKFDLIQMYALVTLVGHHRGRRLPKSFVVVLLADLCRWPLTAVEHALQLRSDDWSEEALAKALHPKPPEEWEIDPETGKRQEIPLHPNEMPWIREMVRLHLMLRFTALAKLGRPVGRLAMYERKTTK